MVRLDVTEKDDRKQASLKMMEYKEDMCSQEAYHGGGTWWLDRWLSIPENRSDIPADTLDMARGVGRIKQKTVSDRIVRTAVLCSQDTHVNTCNLFVSEPGKRKFSGRKFWWFTRTAIPRRQEGGD